MCFRQSLLRLSLIDEQRRQARSSAAPPPHNNAGLFTSSSAWDLYPVAGLQIKMLETCEKVRVQHSGASIHVQSRSFLYPPSSSQFRPVPFHVQIVHTYSRLSNLPAVQFAEKALDRYYPTDESVSADRDIQAFKEALLNTQGSNLRKINSGNKIDTRKELFELAGYMIFLSVAHGEPT